MKLENVIEDFRKYGMRCLRKHQRVVSRPLWRGLEWILGEDGEDGEDELSIDPR